MGKDELAHPLLHATHYIKADVVEFLLECGLHPGKRGTVLPYTGDGFVVSELRAVSPVQLASRMVAQMAGARKSKKKTALLKVQSMLQDAHDVLAVEAASSLASSPSATLEGTMATPTSRRSARSTAGGSAPRSGPAATPSTDRSRGSMVPEPRGVFSPGPTPSPPPPKASTGSGGQAARAGDKGQGDAPSPSGDERPVAASLASALEAAAGPPKATLPSLASVLASRTMASTPAKTADTKAADVLPTPPKRPALPSLVAPPQPEVPAHPPLALRPLVAVLPVAGKDPGAPLRATTPSNLMKGQVDGVVHSKAGAGDALHSLPVIASSLPAQTNEAFLLPALVLALWQQGDNCTQGMALAAGWSAWVERMAEHATEVEGVLGELHPKGTAAWASAALTALQRLGLFGSVAIHCMSAPPDSAGGWQSLAPPLTNAPAGGALDGTHHANGQFAYVAEAGDAHARPSPALAGTHMPHLVLAEQQAAPGDSTRKRSRQEGTATDALLDTPSKQVADPKSDTHAALRGIARLLSAMIGCSVDVQGVLAEARLRGFGRCLTGGVTSHAGWRPGVCVLPSSLQGVSVPIVVVQHHSAVQEWQCAAVAEHGCLDSTETQQALLQRLESLSKPSSMGQDPPCWPAVPCAGAVSSFQALLQCIRREVGGGQAVVAVGLPPAVLLPASVRPKPGQAWAMFESLQALVQWGEAWWPVTDHPRVAAALAVAAQDLARGAQPRRILDMPPFAALGAPPDLPQHLCRYSAPVFPRQVRFGGAGAPGIRGFVPTALADLVRSTFEESKTLAKQQPDSAGARRRGRSATEAEPTSPTSDSALPGLMAEALAPYVTDEAAPALPRTVTGLSPGATHLRPALSRILQDGSPAPWRPVALPGPADELLLWFPHAVGSPLAVLAATPCSEGRVVPGDLRLEWADAPGTREEAEERGGLLSVALRQQRAAHIPPRVRADGGGVVGGWGADPPRCEGTWQQPGDGTQSVGCLGVHGARQRAAADLGTAAWRKVYPIVQFIRAAAGSLPLAADADLLKAQRPLRSTQVQVVVRLPLLPSGIVEVLEVSDSEERSDAGSDEDIEVTAPPPPAQASVPHRPLEVDMAPCGLAAWCAALLQAMSGEMVHSCFGTGHTLHLRGAPQEPSAHLPVVCPGVQLVHTGDGDPWVVLAVELRPAAHRGDRLLCMPGMPRTAHSSHLGEALPAAAQPAAADLRRQVPPALPPKKRRR